MAKLRCGVQRIENGIEIPEKVFEFKSKSERPCYLSGINNDKAIVRYIDTGEFVEVPLINIQKLLPKQPAP